MTWVKAAFTTYLITVMMRNKRGKKYVGKNMGC